MVKPIYLNELPNAEALALVATGAPVVTLVNPVEYHGPHLPLDTDTILSLGTVQETFSKLKTQGVDWPLLVYTDLRVGCGAVPSNGTVPNRYREVKRLVRDTCFGLRTLGAKRVVFATFHGEPLHNLAIDDGVKLLRSWNVAAMATMNLVLNESVEMNLDDYAEVFATIPDETERMRCRDGFPADFHAGFFETSLMLHWRPECVGKNWRDLPPCPPLGSSPAILAIARFFKNRGNGKLAREIEFAHFGLQWAKLRPVGGYTGRPAPSNPDAGRIFATRIAAIVARSMREYFFDGKLPPEPIHRWVRTLSLDGRIG